MFQKRNASCTFIFSVCPLGSFTFTALFVAHHNRGHTYTFNALLYRQLFKDLGEPYQQFTSLCVDALFDDSSLRHLTKRIHLIPSTHRIRIKTPCLCLKWQMHQFLQPGGCMWARVAAMCWVCYVLYSTSCYPLHCSLKANPSPLRHFFSLYVWLHYARFLSPTEWAFLSRSLGWESVWKAGLFPCPWDVIDEVR